MKLTQNNFDEFCEALNHRMSNIESNVLILKDDVAWIKKIGLYLSGIISALTIAIIIKFLMGV